MKPVSTRLGDIYQHGDRASSNYALTFDDGPMPGPTDAILDILKRNNAPATFFVIGQYAQRHPELIRRMVVEGHVVANHTFTHSRLGMLRGWRYWKSEIVQTDAIIASIIEKTPRLFRPPMGVRTPFNMHVVNKTKHACVMWNQRARDGVATTKDRILERLIPNISAGDIVLMHDGRDAASKRDTRPTVDALPELIEAYHAHNFTPVTIDALLKIPAYARSLVV